MIPGWRPVGRALGYVWAAPWTLMGLALGVPLLLGRERARVVHGVLEIHGPVLAWLLARLTALPGGVDAVTLGHVVLGRDADALERTRAHERVHVRQYERWGPLFIPAYLVASMWASARSGHFYRDNPFERHAVHASREDDAVVADV